MVSKVFLATLVISLAYLSEAVFFKDRFPGKTLADLAECQDGYRLVGMRETKPTTKFAPKNGKQCAKYCLKQLLAGERKDNDNKNIVGSMFKASQCYCARYNSPRFVEEAGTFSCVFDPPAVCDMNALNKAEGLEIVGCVDPNNPAGRPNLPGSTCTYTCEDGYEITGADSIKCGSDGKWSGSVPICEEKIIECAEVDEVANAKPMDCTSGTTMIAQSCTLECEDGYELVGNDKITCDIVDGQGVFKATFGECKEKAAAATPLCSDATWLQAGYAQGEDNTGDGYSPWFGGVQNSQEACYQKCIEMTKTHPDINAIGYGIEGRSAKICDCYSAATGFTGVWKAESDLGAWGTNTVFCEMPEAEETTALCSDETWTKAEYADGEDTTGNGYIKSALWVGDHDSKEACYEKCIETKKTNPDINAIGYSVEGIDALSCRCYPSSTGIKGEWKAVLGDWDTHRVFCMMPEAEVEPTESEKSEKEDLIPGETCWIEGQEFAGQTVYTTAEGLTCDDWSPEHGAWHYYDDNAKYDKDSYDSLYDDIDYDTARNWCRNYINDPKGPYCFVGAVQMPHPKVKAEILKGNTLQTQDHFHYCDIPKCP